MVTQLQTRAIEARLVQDELEPGLRDRHAGRTIATLNELIRVCRASARVLEDGSRCVESRIDAAEIEDFAEQRLAFAAQLARFVESLGAEIPVTNGLRRSVRSGWQRLRNLLQSTGPAPTDAELLASLHDQDRRTVEEFDRALQSGVLSPELQLAVERLYGALIVQRYRLGEMMRGWTH